MQPAKALVLPAYSPIWGARSAARHVMAQAPVSNECSQFSMTSASDLRSGKTHRDENFPVASWIIHPRHRALILAFYNFVRTADDIADHATLAAGRKACAFSTCSRPNCSARATASRRRSACAHALAERGMPPRHALDRAHRVPHGRDQAALRELGRGDPLLPLLGDAGRPLHARRPWREHLDLGGLRCAVRGPADQQPSAGLRQGFSRSQSRLPAARCAGRSRRIGRGTRRRQNRRRSCCNACRRWRCGPKRCSTKASRWRRK